MNEKLMHDLIIGSLRERLGREYEEIKVDAHGNPDLILSNHGLVLAMVEVETESSITQQKAETWKALLQQGTKLIIMVPKNSKVKVTELLWQKGIADRVSVGTYDIAITMP